MKHTLNTNTLLVACGYERDFDSYKVMSFEEYEKTAAYINFLDFLKEKEEIEEVEIVISDIKDLNELLYRYNENDDLRYFPRIFDNKKAAVAYLKHVKNRVIEEMQEAEVLNQFTEEYNMSLASI